ncbi:MAG TPA: hypothetical protein VGI80_03715, partial [Pyrinomonadaceae bacterium]
LRRLLFAEAAVVLMLTAYATLKAQDVEVRITIDESQPSVAHVEGRFLKGKRVARLSFLESYAGIAGLNKRIADIKLGDQVIGKAKLGNEANSSFSTFSYSVMLHQPSLFLNGAHISWLSNDRGILALDDLLPQPTDGLSVRVTLDLPKKWRFISNEDHFDEAMLNVNDALRAIIFVGSDWRIKPIPGSQVTLAVSGEHQVPDEVMANEISAIYGQYWKVFGSAPSGSFPQVAIIRFPSTSGAGAWEAETRGSTVTILTSGGLSPADAEQRLEQQLRHELFHLWLPNGVNLSGNYDWFYEGFAVYEASKLGVAMNQIRFEDFLSTIGRAIDIDRFTTKRSLVEASQDRWAGASSQVYARGMLVAFLCDVALLDASKGKTSVESLLKQIVDEHRPPANVINGNDAIIAALRAHLELVPIIDDYINGPKPIDLAPTLQKAGIHATTRDQLTELSVGDKLNGRQKALLDKLGYNNWLKLAPK